MKEHSVSPRMFALALPGRPELFPFDDRAAQFYRDSGYSGVYIEMDYERFGSPASYGCWETTNEVLSLWRFSRDEKAGQYLDWISAQADIAHRNNLKCYLKVWEPRVPASLRDQIPPDARSRGGKPHRNGMLPNVCVMSPAGSGFIREFHQEALTRLEIIDGLIVGVADCFAEFCDDNCPHCAGIPVRKRIIRYFEILRELAAAVRPDLDIILFDWMWKERSFNPDNLVKQYLETRKTSFRFVTVFTQWTHQQLSASVRAGKGLLDCTLAVDGPGPLTKSYLPAVKSGRLRLLDMLSTGNSVEAWAHPPVPAPGVFFRRLRNIEKLSFDGFIDFDNGTCVPSIVAKAIGQYMRGESIESEESFLKRLATDSYGAEAAPIAYRAWKACECALRAYPMDMHSDLCSMVYTRLPMSMQSTIAMIPDLTLFTGKDYGTNPHWVYPYSALVPDVVDAEEEQLALVVASMKTAAALLADAAQRAETDNQSFAQTEAARAEALSLMYQSQHNWAGMARRVYQGGSIGDGSQPGWVRDAFVRERDITAHYAELYEKDHMLFSNPAWDFISIVQLCEPGRTIDRDRPFDDKIAALTRRLKPE